MKNLILIFFLIAITSVLNSQETTSRNGFTCSTEFRYLPGKVYHIYNDKSFNWNSSFYEKNIRLYAGYFFNPQVNVNMGIGADRHRSGLPLFLQAKYYLSENKNSFYFAGEVAYRIHEKTKHFKSYDFNVFIGKEFSLSKLFAINLHAGYDFNRADFGTNSPKDNYHAFLLGVAFMLK